MKKLSLLIMLLWMSSLIMAEEEGLQIVSFKEEMSAEASTQRKLDNNGTPCALLKIQVLTEENISFKSSMIVDTPHKQANEYWVYLAEGAKKIEVSHPLYPSIEVKFSEISNHEIETLKSLQVYKLVISVPQTAVDTVLVAETFQDKLEEARKMYNDCGSHNDTEYFYKAKLLYEAAMNHTDCPQNMLSVLQEEYDKVRFMRKYTNLYEKYNRKVDEQKQNYGFTSDSVYIYLKGAYRAASLLSEKFPNAVSFQQMEQSALQKLQSHPKGKVNEKVTVTTKRASAHGVVTLKKSSQPLNTISIYACKDEKPNSKDERKLVGQVKQDGSFNVTLPDGYHYIIFDGEKKAHSIYNADTKLDITI